MKKITVLSLFFIACICVVFSYGTKTVLADNQKKTLIDIGNLADYAGETIKPFPQYKIIVFSDKTGIYCVFTECTHMRCNLAFRTDINCFVCPCHGAKFSKDGMVMRGPAKKDLVWLEIRLADGGRLIVDKKKTVPTGTKYKFN